MDGLRTIRVLGRHGDTRRLALSNACHAMARPSSFQATIVGSGALRTNTVLFGIMNGLRIIRVIGRHGDTRRLALSNVCLAL